MGAEDRLVESESLSELLANWQAADQQTLEALLRGAYDELRRLAHSYLRKQRPDHTLQSTALVHEAYLRLANHKTLHFGNHNQFFAPAALIMRQILVDYARAREAAKRAGGCRVTLDDSLCLLGGKNLELIALDDALKGLAQLDAQQSRVVELRFFGGLSTEEAAEVGGLSVSADGRWLLFSQIDEISSDLMIVENLQ